MATVAGITPRRKDLDSKSTGGVRRYSHLHGWIPRLGQFVGQEKDMPVDFDEILAAVASRSALVVVPELDRHASVSDIEEAERQARSTYELLSAKDRLRFETPYDENRLTDSIQRDVISWLKQQSGA